MFRFTFRTAVLTIAVLVLASPLLAQRRDHLTLQEVELVRDFQEVDYRMDVFVKAIERRLWAIKGVENLSKDEAKILKKDESKWGELPTGSAEQLYSDIEKILNEAIDKLEDVYDREPKNKRISWAYHILADFSEVLVPKLQAFADGSQNRRELGYLERAARYCNDILEVRNQIPRPSGKRPKRKRY